MGILFPNNWNLSKVISKTPFRYLIEGATGVFTGSVYHGKYI